MPVEHGRNLFKLSEAMLRNGDQGTGEAAILREKAEVFLEKKRPGVTRTGADLESAYSDLIPVYWR